MFAEFRPGSTAYQAREASLTNAQRAERILRDLRHRP